MSIQNKLRTVALCLSIMVTSISASAGQEGGAKMTALGWSKLVLDTVVEAVTVEDAYLVSVRRIDGGGDHLQYLVGLEKEGEVKCYRYTLENVPSNISIPKYVVSKVEDAPCGTASRPLSE